MMNWRKPHEQPHAGPHAPPPHVRHGKPPHEHLYDACEAILANMQELSDRMASIERQMARAGS
jgi:hypothetical protein